MMGDANFLEKGIAFLVCIPPPIGLHCNYLPREESLNNFLEIMKKLKHLRLEFQQINPIKFTIIINKGNIISIASSRSRCWTPYIRIGKF
jgi:hypothetical protein